MPELLFLPVTLLLAIGLAIFDRSMLEKRFLTYLETVAPQSLQSVLKIDILYNFVKGMFFVFLLALAVAFLSFY